jgi:hypothetical protein
VKSHPYILQILNLTTPDVDGHIVDAPRMQPGVVSPADTRSASPPPGWHVTSLRWEVDTTRQIAKARMRGQRFESRFGLSNN